MRGLNETDNIKYGMYLTELISSVLNSTSPKEPFEGFDWNRLYKLAVLHNVAIIIYPAVKQLAVPEEIMLKFERNRNIIVAREARCDIETARVFSALSDNGIRFIKLKGIVLKNLYPKAYMRTYIDVDLCVSSEDRIKAKDIMLGLGYELEGSADYHDGYEKDSFFIYEIHSSVFSNTSKFHDIFEDAFSLSKAVGEFEYVLTDEYFYLHLLFHIYKHLMFGGCGIRAFVDLYVFEKAHSDMDWSLIERVVNEQGLGEYLYHIRKLIKIFFDSEEPELRYEQISEFVFKSGEYGSSELKKTVYLTNKKTLYLGASQKLKLFTDAYFPGIDIMKIRYPVLEKAPVLLPICWIRRGFYTIFHKREALKEHQETVRSLESDEVKEAKRVHELIGIK